MTHAVNQLPFAIYRSSGAARCRDRGETFVLSQRREDVRGSPQGPQAHLLLPFTNSGSHVYISCMRNAWPSGRCIQRWQLVNRITVGRLAAQPPARRTTTVEVQRRQERDREKEKMRKRPQDLALQGTTRYRRTLVDPHGRPQAYSREPTLTCLFEISAIGPTGTSTRLLHDAQQGDFALGSPVHSHTDRPDPLRKVHRERQVAVSVSAPRGIDKRFPVT